MYRKQSKIYRIDKRTKKIQHVHAISSYHKLNLVSFNLSFICTDHHIVTFDGEVIRGWNKDDLVTEIKANYDGRYWKEQNQGFILPRKEGSTMFFIKSKSQTELELIIKNTDVDHKNIFYMDEELFLFRKYIGKEEHEYFASFNSKLQKLGWISSYTRDTIRSGKMMWMLDYHHAISYSIEEDRLIPFSNSSIDSFVPLDTIYTGCMAMQIFVIGRIIMMVIKNTDKHKYIVQLDAITGKVIFIHESAIPISYSRTLAGMSGLTESITFLDESQFEI